MTEFIWNALGVPDLVASGGMLAIAALLLFVNPRDGLHRAFALLLLLLGISGVLYFIRIGYAQTDPSTSEMIRSIELYYDLATPFAVVYFAIRFLGGGVRQPWARLASWLLLGGVTMVLLAFMNDHALVSSRTEAGRIVGPLWLIATPTRFVLFAGVALLFAMQAARASSPGRATGLHLASLAFASVATFWASINLVMFGAGLSVLGARGSPEVLAATNALFILLSALLAGIVIVVARTARQRAEEHVGREARRVLGALGIAATSGVAAAALRLASHPAGAIVTSFMDGVWLIAIPALVGYALLRHQLFGIDVKIRWTLSKTTVAAAFIAVFFIASEIAQEYFGETLGSTYVGIAAAGALVFALAPLQRVAERFAERAIPVADGPALTEPSSGSGVSGSERLFRDALRLAVRGGRLTREEEATLHQLAEALRIRPGRAHEMLADAEREHQTH